MTSVGREVDDPNLPELAVFMGLRDRALRQRRESPGGELAGVFMAEGDLVIQRALATGHRLVSVLVDRARTTPLPPEVPDDVALFVAGPEVLREISGYPSYRGALACFERPEPQTVEQLLTDPAVQTFAVTEGVQNPNNMGLILRNAAALGVDALLADPTSCDPLSRRSCRVSMGQVFRVDHARVVALPEGFASLADAGVVTIALTPDPGAIDIDEFDPGVGRVAVALGAEGPGLSAETMAACDHRVRIRMEREVDSLNVGVAAAVAFAAVRRWNTVGIAELGEPPASAAPRPDPEQPELPSFTSPAATTRGSQPVPDSRWGRGRSG